MSESRTKLEQILELLLSEDTEKAEAALHEYVVGKAREEYMRVLDESDDEEFGDEEIDQTGDFEDEIAADQDEIHSDETGDEFADDEFADDGEDFADDQDGDVELDVEDRVDDIEADLEDLRAEFERLMTADLDDAGDEESAEELEDFSDEDFGDEEELEEATKLSDKAPAIKDGNAHTDSSASKSPYSDAPKHSKIDSQGKPHHNKDGSDGKDSHGGSKKHQNPTDSNLKIAPKKAVMPKQGE